MTAEQNVFQDPVGMDGKPGRTEQFVKIEVHVSEEPIEFDPSSKSDLDGVGLGRLKEKRKGKKCRYVKGVAYISWKEDGREACVKDHERGGRKIRCSHIQKYAARMKAGEYPRFAHVYVHPSLTGEDNLVIIDGTRRMAAYLEAGKGEMPVVVITSADEGT